MLNYTPHPSTVSEEMQNIVAHFKRGRISYHEATKAIYRNVTRHKYSEQAQDAAMQALLSITPRP